MLLVVLGFPWAAAPARAQSVVHTIANVPSPNHRALNQATNRLYVTNAGTTAVTVVDTASEATHTIDLGAGNSPVGIALDATTNLLYVTLTNGTLALLDGATDTVVDTDFFCCPALTSPSGIALDTTQNVLYVADTGANRLVVIDAAAMKPSTNDGLIGTVALGAGPADVVFHATNNQVYATNNGGTTVSVVNRQVGTRRLNATLATTIDLSVAPVALGLNPVTQLLHNRCQGNALDGMLVSGSFNTIERNYGFANAGDGIAVVGSFNTLNHNQGRANGGHGVVATGGGNTSDGRNYGTGNTAKPDCSIDGRPPVTADGRYC